MARGVPQSWHPRRRKPRVRQLLDILGVELIAVGQSGRANWCAGPAPRAWGVLHHWEGRQTRRERGTRSRQDSSPGTAGGTGEPEAGIRLGREPEISPSDHSRAEGLGTSRRLRLTRSWRGIVQICEYRWSPMSLCLWPPTCVGSPKKDQSAALVTDVSKDDAHRLLAPVECEHLPVDGRG